MQNEEQIKIAGVLEDASGVSLEIEEVNNGCIPEKPIG